MKHRRDDLQLSPINRLRIGMRGNWGQAGCGLGVLAACFLAYWLILSQSALPLEKEQAEIVRFGARGDLNGAQYLVVLRLKDGRSVTIPVSQRLLSRCRPGDRIRVVRQGAGIESLDSSSCRSPSRPPRQARGA